MPQSRGRNPFRPGDPVPDPFVGRLALRESFAADVLARMDDAGSAPPLIILGLSGVGKTACLNILRQVAEDAGWLAPMRQKADANGEAPFAFRSSWEREILAEVIADPKTVAWLRNDPYGENAALRITHRDRNATVRPFYPDFLVVRQSDQGLAVDVLDPHDPKLEDAASKAVGLAEFSRDHGLAFGQIDLIAESGGRLKRLHLQDQRTREEVLKVKTDEDLLKLYERA